jgi:hypothetical protein
VTSAWAVEVVSAPVACTTIWFSEPNPLRLCCTAGSGAMATSSASCAPLDPAVLSTPTTVNGTPDTLTCLPIGSAVPNSSSATVWPMTMTFLAAITSSL